MILEIVIGIIVLTLFLGLLKLIGSLYYFIFEPNRHKLTRNTITTIVLGGIIVMAFLLVILFASLIGNIILNWWSR